MDLGGWLGDLGRAVDARALPALYAAVSVSPEHVRTWLRRRALPFLDPAAPAPSLQEVDRTADHVIAQSQATGAAIGAFAGLGGALGVPSEVAAWIVACLRMAQRLAVVYGFDPSSDRGHAALTRAVAAGFAAELPERGLVELRLSEVLAGLRPKRPTTVLTPEEVRAKVGTQVARVVVWRSVRLAAGRFGRLLPIVSSGAAASGNHAEAAVVGARMKAVLRRLADAPSTVRAIEEAQEVPGGRRGRT